MKLKDMLKLVSGGQDFEVLNYISFRKYKWSEIADQMNDLEVVTVEAVDDMLGIYVH